MQKIYNFCAGPAMLPKAVMERAQKEFVDWNGHGTSVMEVSHRGKPFIEVAEKAEQDLKQLLAIPDNYKVLFLQGGGRGQFFSVPMNLAKRGDRSQHLVSGQWSQIAVSEAEKYMPSTVVAKTQTIDERLWVPTQDQWQIDEDAAYFHYCPNETVDGIEIPWVPASENVPIVADMSSNILSKKIDVADYGIIYAGAQKNIGPSGLAVVIVREDLLGYARADTPSMFEYQQQVNNDSMYNTPPTFSWYLAGLVFEWLLEQGGLSAMEQINQEKSDLLYKCIDESDFYQNRISDENRSRMNVTFHLKDNSLDAAFLEQSQKAGLLALKGHRLVGGMRASIYNAMPLKGIKTLVSFMQDFEKSHG